MSNPETTWLYFHSAVFQGDMALLAFVGVFVVFKLQQISSELQSQFRNIDTYVRQYMSVNGVPIPLNFYDIPSLKTEINRTAQEGSGGNVFAKSSAAVLNEDRRYISSIAEYERKERGRKSIIHRFWWPVVPLSIAILGSLVTLPLYDSFASCYCTIVVAFIVLNSVAFAANVLYVRFVVGQTGAVAERVGNANHSEVKAGK